MNGGGGAAPARRPVLAVDEENIGPAVAIGVEERAAGPHGLGQPFLSEGAVVVREVNTGLRRDVAEVNLLGGAKRA